jgi:hypothetical protein
MLKTWKINPYYQKLETYSIIQNSLQDFKKPYKINSIKERMSLALTKEEKINHKQMDKVMENKIAQILISLNWKKIPMLKIIITWTMLLILVTIVQHKRKIKHKKQPLLWIIEFKSQINHKRLIILMSTAH